MGLSIHYKGRFSKNASLSAMIEEVRDIAEVYKWQYTVYETAFPAGSLEGEDFNDNIYGIIFVAPGCEPVYLTFLSNGRMSTELGLEFWGKAKDEKAKYLYLLSTKTQYGGLHTHVTIIQMLRYLSKKYLSHFELIDEGGYWETNDIKVVTETFKHYNDMMDAVAGALKNNRLRKGENIEDFFERVLKQIQIRKIKNKD